MEIPKYSMGIGDRFSRQGEAQLAALIKAAGQGVEIAPVWNKSHREHTIIGSTPADVRVEADGAVKACRWEGEYFVDADHIGLDNVDLFIEASDFFTLDVAEAIGLEPDENDLREFVRKHSNYVGSLSIEGIDEEFEVTAERIEQIGRKFLAAVKQAGAIYRHVVDKKGADAFVTEVSMDESDQPQTPMELFFILAAISDQGIAAQTIAPKFTGRFNKGVDYVGDVAQFTKEFAQDLAVIDFATKQFANLPANLKLSVHSGSDKFSIYKPMHEAIKKFDAGLHLKTAGTTWLEEIIGLASSGGEGLALAKEIYAQSLSRYDELVSPYATVLDIDTGALPRDEDVQQWSAEEFAAALRHDLSNDAYNLNFRQLLHVGYKVAAQMGHRYTQALEDNKQVIAENVTTNIYDRHIVPIFIGENQGLVVSD